MSVVQKIKLLLREISKKISHTAISQLSNILKGKYEMNTNHDVVIDQVKECDGWTAATISVTMAILSHCHNQKHQCFPSIHRLMSITGLSRRAVQKHLRFLENATIIRTVQRFSINGRSTSSMYTVSYLEKLNYQGHAIYEDKTLECKGLDVDESLSPLFIESASDAPLKALGYKPRQKHVATLFKYSVNNFDKTCIEKSNVCLAKSDSTKPNNKVTEKSIQANKSCECNFHKRQEKNLESDGSKSKPASNQVVKQEYGENNKKWFSVSKTIYSRTEKIDLSRKSYEIQGLYQPKLLRFYGEFATLEKSLEIYDVFRTNGWIKQSEFEFIEYLGYYAAIVEKYKNKVVRNPFAYLVNVVKLGIASKLIRSRHEEKARNTAKRIHLNGQYPLF